MYNRGGVLAGSSVHDFLTNLDMGFRRVVTVVTIPRKPPCIYAGIYHALLPTGTSLSGFGAVGSAHTWGENSQWLFARQSAGQAMLVSRSCGVAGRDREVPHPLHGVTEFDIIGELSGFGAVGSAHAWGA